MLLLTSRGSSQEAWKRLGEAWAAAVISHAREDHNNIIAKIIIMLLLTSRGSSQEAWGMLGKRPNCSQAGWVAGWPER